VFVAKPTVGQTEEEELQIRYKAWNRFSLVYGILSITAKTFLEIGFVLVVSIYKPFELAPPAIIQSGFMVNPPNHTCFSIVPKPV